MRKEENGKKSFGISKKAFKKWIGGFLCTLPVILGVLIFTYYPAIQSLIYSFYDYDGFFKFDFIGFDNFTMMFRYDPDTAQVFGNTFLYAVVSVPLNLALGYLLALAANSKVKGIAAFRVLFYLPVIIPGVASGILFSDLFSAGTDGIFNRILVAMGIPRQPFFYSSDTAMATMIVMGLWGLGGSMIIWLSAFKNIDATLYESAKLDGANAFQRLLHITIPMSSSVIFYNLVTGVIGALQTTSTLFVGGQDGKGIGNSLYFITVTYFYGYFSCNNKIPRFFAGSLWQVWHGSRGKSTEKRLLKICKKRKSNGITLFGFFVCNLFSLSLTSVLF